MGTKSSYSNPGDVLIEIKRLNRIYNDMVSPRDIEGMVLHDDDIVEVVMLGPPELADMNIGDKGRVVCYSNGFRFSYDDGSFKKMDYRSARGMKIISR